MENGEEEFSDQFFVSTEGRNDIRREKIKELILQIRQDTLRQVLPDDEFVEGQDDLEYYGGDISINDAKKGFNLCIEKIENKAKEIWGIDLTN